MKITSLDAATLMQAAMEAAKHRDIGLLDADRPLARLRMRLNEKIDVDQQVVESALSSLMELSDVKKWKHPDGMSLEGFIQKITPWGSTYNSKYRVFEKGNK
jgi:hypothetical protein